MKELSFISSLVSADFYPVTNDVMKNEICNVDITKS